MLSDKELFRFWQKVDMPAKTDGCWEWVGMKQKGYGYLKLKGIRRRAHRVSYEQHVGPVGTKIVCHKCDNPGCVNPDHLFLGNQAENMADKVKKGRQAKGAGHGMSVLTPGEVLGVFYALGTQREIAKAYGVSQSQAGRIRRGDAWGDITGGKPSPFLELHSSGRV